MKKLLFIQIATTVVTFAFVFKGSNHNYYINLVSGIFRYFAGT